MDIYVAGFPLGDPEYTLTRGVISKEKADGEMRWASVASSVEYDATTLPGNSGGPVVNDNAQVVAVHYAGNHDSRQVFGISAELAKPVTDELATGKRRRFDRHQRRSGGQRRRQPRRASGSRP